MLYAPSNAVNVEANTAPQLEVEAALEAQILSQLQAEAEAESFADAEADAEWGFVKNIVRSVARPFIPAPVVVRPPPPPKPHAVGGELEGFAFQNGNCQRKLCQNWSDGQQRCKAPTVVDIGICCG